MSLPSQPPQYARWSDLLTPIKRGETGWRAWAVQRALLGAGYPLPTWGADGDFGEETETALRRFQGDHGIDRVGFAGPATQRALLATAEHAVHTQLPRLPEGVLLGFAVSEGASVLAATNWYTPQGGKLGVDCGAVQWRQYGPPFDLAGLKAAFDPRSAFQYAGKTLLERIDDFDRRRPSLTDEMVLRLALLAHNWPAGAEQVVRYGRLSTPNALAMWTSKPSGGLYTLAEWLQEYPNRILVFIP
jgi:hypothetical protein